MNYKYHIFCCVNQRPENAKRECCQKKGSVELRNYFKNKILELDIKKVRVNQSGCLDKCELGPVVVIYPEGVWYKCQTKDDVDLIIQSHILNGKVVRNLLIKKLSKV